MHIAGVGIFPTFSIYLKKTKNNGSPIHNLNLGFYIEKYCDYRIDPFKSRNYESFGEGIEMKITQTY